MTTTTLTVPAPDATRPALHVEAYGPTYTSWCDHAPSKPRAPGSAVPDEDRTCGWEYNAMTFLTPAVDLHRHAANHRHDTGHRVVVIEATRFTYAPQGGV